MGNLEGWGGPVSQEWIDDRYSLQKQILNRMEALDMNPILPGFYGNIPRSGMTKYPNAKIIDGGVWCGFYRPGFLSADDEFLDSMARVYYTEIEKMYGVHKFFSGDPFHEGGNAEELTISWIGAKVQQTMQEVHPGSIWVLQGWMDNPKSELL